MLIKCIRLLLTGAALVFPQSWLDPAGFPRASACDTSGLVKPYSDYSHGVRQYAIHTTPPDPANPGRFLAPVIDGTLEDAIWSYADTLLLNSWEAAGEGEACITKPTFTGPGDLHAIWRFCYNHDALYVGCEVHDNIWNVDTLKPWYSEDGVEISVDPWDWGYYPDKWSQDLFPRYWASSSTLNAAVQPYGLSQATAFVHLLKRMNEEPYVAGLVQGVLQANYWPGNEVANFARGCLLLSGIDFAAKQHGADPWGRAVWHLEFKFPYHNAAWSVLEGKGYYDSDGLPVKGKLFKMSFANNDKDLPPFNGYTPDFTQLSTTRSVPFNPSDPHWSDTRGFMTFKYGGVSSARVVHVFPSGMQAGVEAAAGRSASVMSVDHYPNPFNPSATVRFTIPPRQEAVPFTLVIYNVKGEAVRLLARGIAGASGINRSVVWDGKNNNGQPVCSGNYCYRLNAGGKTLKGNMALVK